LKSDLNSELLKNETIKHRRDKLAINAAKVVTSYRSRKTCLTARNYEVEEVQMSGYRVDIDGQEAMLIDWVLTMHSYSQEYLDYLMRPDVQQIRYQAGQIIVNGKGQLELLEEEMKWLLAILPITFRFGKEDVGYSLKKKLYFAFLSKQGEYTEEVRHASHS